jgi:predicted nuclease of predicted toxin-antitoxin system
VVSLGLESASDVELWQVAKDEGFVIVTRDADREELSLDSSVGVNLDLVRHVKHRLACG